ncbi:MAG TPA: hypothetical protein PLV52_05500, partial [Candidatus Omnitrophota bacterium]|nr:hypothetical protein [Candidatus Omnitrophota bacterium]
FTYKGTRISASYIQPAVTLSKDGKRVLSIIPGFEADEVSTVYNGGQVFFKFNTDNKLDLETRLSLKKSFSPGRIVGETTDLVFDEASGNYREFTDGKDHRSGISIVGRGLAYNGMPVCFSYRIEDVAIAPDNETASAKGLPNATEIFTVYKGEIVFFRKTSTGKLRIETRLAMNPLVKAGDVVGYSIELDEASPGSYRDYPAGNHIAAFTIAGAEKYIDSPICWSFDSSYLESDIVKGTVGFGDMGTLQAMAAIYRGDISVRAHPRAEPAEILTRYNNDKLIFRPWEADKKTRPFAEQRLCRSVTFEGVMMEKNAFAGLTYRLDLQDGVYKEPADPLQVAEFYLMATGEDFTASKGSSVAAGESYSYSPIIDVYEVARVGLPVKQDGTPLKAGERYEAILQDPSGLPIDSYSYTDNITRYFGREPEEKRFFISVRKTTGEVLREIAELEAKNGIKLDQPDPENPIIMGGAQTLEYVPVTGGKNVYAMPESPITETTAVFGGYVTLKDSGINVPYAVIKQPEAPPALPESETAPAAPRISPEDLQKMKDEAQSIENKFEALETAPVVPTLPLAPPAAAAVPEALPDIVSAQPPSETQVSAAGIPGGKAGIAALLLSALLAAPSSKAALYYKYFAD